MKTNDFDTSELTGEALTIANIVKNVLGQEADNGGCQAFRDPDTWDDTYGRQSKLILVHDGGDLARYCSYDYQDYSSIEKLSQALAEGGYWVEQCTTWYSAVYKN